LDKRYRSMDLLRSVAILLVLLAHSILSYGAPDYLAPLQLGGTGVDLFFLLSGWLLGGLLFKEGINSGKIDVRKFWIRRWMRTLPAYYVVLIFSVLQRYLTKEDVNFPWEYFTFIQNYATDLPFFFVSWSLSVEEQFYLLIAPLLGFFIKFKKKTVTGTLLLLLVTPYLFRQFEWYSSVYETHVSLDGCVAGVFLAHIRYHYENFWTKISTYAPGISVISLSIYILFYVARYFPNWGFSDPDKLLLVLIFGSWVMLANSSPKWQIKLYVPGAYYIATRSYALYLLHPEVLAIQKRYLTDAPFVIYFCIALIGSILVAEILYRSVEKPFMVAREAYSFSRSKP
jgi:peptidoglycan/LPS O-acetylase OafA/YrhL